MKNSEKWMPVKGLEQEYEVSTYGRVRSVDRMVACRNGYRRVYGRILRPNIGTNGYLYVNIGKRTRYIHNMVAETFIGDRRGFDVDHINNVKTDNRLGNLQLLSHLENVRKSKCYKRGYDMHGGCNPRARRVIAVLGDNQTKFFECIKDAAKEFGFSDKNFQSKARRNNGIYIVNNIRIMLCS